MTQVKVPWKARVLVCDGAKALLFRNDGDAQYPNLVLLQNLVGSRESAHAVGSARPGRVHESHDSRRSAVEETDPHEQAEAAFLAHLAEILEQEVRAQKVEALILVASPRALGVLRGRLAPAVRAVVTAELAKDLTHLPVGDIERHLAA